MNCDNCRDYTEFLITVTAPRSYTRDDGLDRNWDITEQWCIKCFKERLNKENE